jgi:hypothetical protein
VIDVFSPDEPRAEVQRLTISDTLGRSDLDGGCTGLGSPCSLALFVGHGGMTVEFALNAPAADVRHRLLAALKDAAGGGGILPPAFRNIEVSRAATPSGYVFDITFVGDLALGGAGNLPPLALGPSSLTNAANQNSAADCGATGLGVGVHDNSCITLGLETLREGARAFGRGEAQLLVLAADDGAAGVFSPPQGFFRLAALAAGSGLAGAAGAAAAGAAQTTPLLPADVDAATLAAALSALPGLRAGVRVERVNLTDVAIATAPAPRPLGAPAARVVTSLGAAGTGTADG